jgi:hypothetical protein
MYEHLTTPCIKTTRKLDDKGYARIGVKRFGKLIRRAHVLAWVDANGRLPNPETPCILHHCDNRACINPEHLYEGTQQDNVRDMVERRRCWQMQVTHCPQGHEYTEENSIIDARHGGRTCRACRLDRKRQRRLERATAEGREVKTWARYRTTCPQGHVYDEANTRWRPDGSRACRECSRRTSREYSLRMKVRKEAA